MSQSVFDGLALDSDGGVIRISYPGAIHDAARAAEAATTYGLTVRADRPDVWTVECAAGGSRCPVIMKTFFADLNRNPGPYECDISGYTAPAGEPLVSCVIIVNENALFVREQLVPSLLLNSGGHPIEIVLVYNGVPEVEPELARFTNVRSVWGAVSAAYNAGARTARGQYLALFHDDCIVDDPQWIEKCIAALSGGLDAVAGEYRYMHNVAGIAVPALPIAKSVPLFMRRTSFLEAGGYDEFHYVGYEDLDLTLALLRGGMKLKAIDLQMRHYNGMSSTLKYCPVPGLDALYGMAALPRDAIRRRFREFSERGMMTYGVDLLRMALDVQLLYVLKKFRGYLNTIDAQAYARAAEELERRVTRGCPFDATLIVPHFRDLDRRLAQAAA
ncbi:MAG: glycosyltransferase [Betaproteobacteria bacterium]|jgi:hypothetical protein|nr:glycosyltransferase [Betaproteobacteria bacterium]